MVKPGDLYIVTRVPGCAKHIVKCGTQAVLIEAETNLNPLMKVRIRHWQFWWHPANLLRISL